MSPVPRDVGAEMRAMIVRSVSAFDALLAVAQEAWDHRDDACRVPHTALDVALAQLDTAHPGWREWTP